MDETTPEYLLRPFDLQTTSVLVEALNRAYPAHARIRDGYRFEEFAKVTAGCHQGGQVRDHLLAGKDRLAPNLIVASHPISKSPHYYVTLASSELLLEVVPCNKGPLPRRLPKTCKHRVQLAARSMIEPRPRIRPLPELAHLVDTPRDTEAPILETQPYAFGALIHSPEPKNRSKLGGLHVVLVDQNYEPAYHLDLLEHLRKLRTSTAVSPKIIPFPVRVKRIQE